MQVCGLSKQSPYGGNETIIVLQAIPAHTAEMNSNIVGELLGAPVMRLPKRTAELGSLRDIGAIIFYESRPKATTTRENTINSRICKWLNRFPYE